MNQLDLEAQISRAQVCLNNATDPADQRHWWGVMQEAKKRLEAERSAAEKASA